MLAMSMAAVLVGCQGDPATVQEGSATVPLWTFSTVLPVADSSMNVIDLPDASIARLSFTAEANLADQAKTIPLFRSRKFRTCVVDTFRDMGLGAYLDPDAEPGSVPVFSEPPSLIGINCRGYQVTMSFHTVLGGSNNDGPVYAVSDVIIEVIEKTWDKSCRELTCLQNDYDGKASTCGCLESNLASCSACPLP